MHHRAVGWFASTSISHQRIAASSRFSGSWCGRHRPTAGSRVEADRNGRETHESGRRMSALLHISSSNRTPRQVRKVTETVIRAMSELDAEALLLYRSMDALVRARSGVGPLCNYASRSSISANCVGASIITSCPLGTSCVSQPCLRASDSPASKPAFEYPVARI
jgi:hypothetical protein